MSHVVQAIVSIGARTTIVNNIQNDDSLETGGLLLGEYAPNACAHVMAATGPGPRAYKTRATVDFDAIFLQEEQDRLIRESPHLCFLGDWHYHPSGKGQPSNKDIRVLGELTHDPDYQLGSMAIILILYPGQPLKIRGFRLKMPGKIIEIPVCFDVAD
jgi:integrative and conjugative element protein (TIGR02256 family)